MRSLQILALCSLLASAVAQSGSLKCGGKWQQYNGKCYIAVGSKKSWGDARKDCQKRGADGGDLVLIPDTGTNTFLKKVLTGVSDNTWIGLHDIAKENTFKWVDDQTPAAKGFTNWAAGEPNNVGEEDCVMIYTSDPNLVWNDDACSTKLAYVCERSINAVPKCDSANGWKNYNGMCYRLFTYKTTWQTAENDCKLTPGGHLAYAKTADDQAFLDNLQYSHGYEYWLGLSDKKSNKQGVYKWSDDSAFDATNDFSKWDKNQPSNQFYGKEGDCARVKTTGSWYTQKCTDKSRYVCAIPEGACAQGWHFFNGQCYQVNSNTPMTWTDAKDYCTQQSAYLTTIKTDAENNFFKQFLVDMNNQNINVLYFGLSDVAKDDELRWVDGLKLGSYKHWNQGMTPTLTPKVKDCGYITTGDSNDAFWNVGDCFMLGAFICKINAGTKVTPVPPGVVDGSCENSKWDLHGDYCYKVTTSQSTWDSASSECKKLGAELASIHNDGTQSYMSVRMNTLSSWVWIGLNDKAVEGTYVWTDGSSYDYNNWSPGHPKTDDCVAMVSGANNYGLWRTRPCTKNYYYVCQKMKLPGPGVTNAPPPTMNYYARCGNGWEYYKPSDRCFLFRPYDYKNWFNARYQCRVEGGDLMSLSNPVDQTYAASRLKTSTESISWLGCNDLGVEGGWVWTDKKPFVFIDWNPGQPDNWFGGSSTGEHCCQFYNNIGTWNDNYCETGLGYSCNRDDYIFKYYISFPEKQLLGNDDKTLKNIFPSECARRCVTETDFTCRSFDYERNKMTCYLSKTDKNVAGGLVPSFESQHFDYYERDFSVAVPIPTKAPGTDMGCAKGWGRYKGFCYFANLAALEFAEAEKACKNQGAEMASILDMNANNFLRANIYEKTKTITRYWIGLNDKKTEMLYEWSDGTPVTYTNWYAHEPNDANGEDCVEIYTDIGYWNDLNCKGYTFSSICKKPLSSGNPVHLPAATCPTGWTGWNDVCYKMDSTKATWTDAGTQCKTAGGRLVIIEDKYELSFLSAQLGMENGDDFFIGFSDSKTPGLYEWMDGSSVTYTNWAEGQPDDQAGNCVTMNSGMDAGYWTARDCSVKRRYICEKAGNGQPPLTPPPAITPTQPSDTDCQAGWTGYGTQCFRIFEFQSDSDMVTWDEANRQCINMGANLASFHHPDQQAYLVQQFTPTSSNGFWIGLNDQRKEGGYAWSDGTQVEFTDWAPGEPNDYGGQEECVEIYLQSDNKWNDLYCWYQRNFICQIPKGESVITTPAPTIPTGDPCPGNDKWIHRAPYCYYFSQAMDGVLGWAEAEEFCHKNNAHLVSVHSNDEQSFLKKYASFFASGYWIGLRSNLTHPGEYQWADETNLDFVNWQKGQPDSVNGAELCVEMKMFPNTGEWRDNNCGDWAKFICQKTVDDVPMVTHAPTTPPTGECPNGWKKYNNRCYTIGGKNEGSKKNWQDARKECQTLNAAASLASIHDIAVQTYLTADLIDVNFDVWIGMSSLGSSGNFLWADNTPADYFNWGFNQPDWPFKGNRTDCVLMMNEEEEPGRWNDVDCMALNSYLCVMKPDDKYTNPTTPPKCDGLPEYEKYGDACFKVDIITKRTFEEAKTFCQKDGANVASIRNGYEQAKLQSMVMKADRSVWIGLYDDPATGVFTWIDGWPLYYTNWGWLSPIGLPCAVMKEGGFFTEAGEWSNVGCGMKSYTACKYTTAVPPTKVPDSEGKCPDDWTAYGSSCYIMGSGFFSTGSFPEARYDCQTNYGADLATISSKDENHFVLGLAQKSFDVSWLIMGLHRSNNGGWKWIDGSPVAFTNWANGEPDDDSAGCAEIWPDSQGKWFDVSCTVNSHYVCEMPKLPLFTTEAPFTKPPYCPTDPDWLFVSPYCYYVEDSKEKTWYDAEAWCNTKGGYLASIHDDQEQILVKGLTPYSYNYFWIGLKKLDDSNSVDEYRWSDSSPSDFTNWDYGQPNDGLGMQKCVDMADDGLWGDTNCGIEQHFVCKKDYNNKVPIVKPDPPPAEGNCPNGWFKIDKGCYQINGDTSDFKTWDNARTACKANEGGGLASIHNQAVQSLLTSLMKFSTGNLWTGLSNKVGYYYEYHWSDNSNVDFQHWASNQPSYPYVDTACGVLVNDPSYPGRWDDVDCSEQHGYLCYKPLDPALPTQEPSFGGLCPANGFLQYGTDCFKLMTTPMSFIDAKKACEGQTATLASVRDGFSEAFIVANMLYKNNLDSAWIGLTINDNTGTFKWIDRWPLMFTSWADFEPSEEDGEGCVVQTNSADWDSIKCTLKRAFVCHTTEMVPPTPPSFIPGNCPPKWIGFGDNCYMFEAELQYVSWWEASYFCEKTFDNSHILNIHSRGENAFVKRVAAEKYGYYGVWLGLTRNTTAVDKQEFLWNDGQPLDYTNWKVGEPDNELDSEDCVRIMTSEYGKWEDTGCASYSQLVCKRPKDKSSVGGCEKDWYRMNNLCYGAFGSNEPESLTWTEAYKSCENKGGNLATVYGQNVLSLLEAMMFMMRRTNAWIGLNKIDGSYEWADGTPMQFEHWTENFPDKDPDNMCVMIVNNQVKPGFWKNLPCEGPREGYFCQKPTDPAIPDFPTGDSCSQKGYYRHNGVCYKVYDQMDQRKNFADAQAQCEKDTGNLATVTDGFVEAFMETLLFYYNIRDAWIGLMQDSTGKFLWVNGDPLVYTNWDEGEPSSNQGEGCVRISDGQKWDNVGCAATHSFICQIGGGGGPIPSTPKPPSCLTGWQQFGSKCYRFVAADNSNMSYDAAKAACAKSSKAVLPDVHSFEQNLFISKYAQGLKGSATIWLGLVKDNQGDFKYDNNAKLDYAKWDTNQPSMDEGLRCVGMNKQTATWTSLSCDVKTDFVCQMDAYGGPRPKPPAQTGGGCQNGWYQMDSYCYKSFGSAEPEAKSWTDAEADCTDQSGHLAAVYGQNVLSLLEALMFQLRRQNAWIGLNKASTPDYTWSDGHSYEFSHWKPGSPDNNENNKCVMMINNEVSPGQWINAPCGSDAGGSRPPTEGYFCQKPTDPQLPSFPSGDKCNQEGYFRYRNTCYRVFGSITQQKSFVDAQKRCTQDQGTLVAIRDGFSDAFMETLLYYYKISDAWIGLKRDNLGTFTKWLTGEDVNYKNWAVDQPTEIAGADCVRISNGQRWDNLACEAKHNFICQTGGSEAGGCAMGWFNMKNMCYRGFGFSPPTAKTWNEAEKDCISNGGNLASVTTQYVLSLLEALMIDSRRMNAWIGLNKKTSNSYEWTDGATFEFAHWKPGSPNTNNASKCVMILNNEVSPGLWSNFPCGDGQRDPRQGYFCQKRADPNLPQEPSGKSCFRDGYFSYNDNCYKVFDKQSQQMNFTSAQSQCQADDATLAVITEGFSEAFAETLLYYYGIQDAWIGLQKTDYQQAFSWVNGEPLNYKNWAPNEPSKNPGEGCVRISDANSWDNVDCNTKHNFICQSGRDLAGGCEKGWYNMMNKCYAAFGSTEPTSKTWIDADQDCKSKGGQLATVEAQYVLSLLEAMMFEMRHSNAWIGLNRRSSGNYQWVDGTPYRFGHWQKGFPQDIADKKCVMIVNNELTPGYWVNVACGENPREPRGGYFCQKPADPSLDHNPTPDLCEKPGYFRYRGLCYKAFPSTSMLMSFNDAQSQCVKDGANLATVHDGFIQAYMETLMFYFGLQDVWIGYQLKKGASNFTWIDGGANYYQNWGRNEPSSNKGDGCVRISEAQTWDSTDCNTKHNFICVIGGKPTPGKQTGLGGGAVAAIILSILVAIVFIMAVAYYLVKSRQSQAPTDAEPKLGFDNVLYTPSADDTQVESKGASDA